MKLFTNEPPVFEEKELVASASGRSIGLPCVVLTSEETEQFIGEDEGQRRALHDAAATLIEGLEPKPAEVIVYSPRCEVVTTLVPGYKFVSSEMA